MRLRFTVEDGCTYMALTLAPEDKELLDRQCSRLGLTESTTSLPLGFGLLDGVARVPFWKDRRAGQLAGAIQARVTQELRMHGSRPLPRFSYVDDINAVLYQGSPETGEVVNVGLLRFKPAVGEAVRFKVHDGIYSPEEMQHIQLALAKAYNALAAIVFEATVDLIVQRPSGSR